MNLVRKYLRGSGRVLAFVFVASVIWLLFDMAALRISLTDVSGQQLKERVIKERELFKKQSRVTEVVRRGFRNPVHVSERAPLNPDKLDQVDRRKEMKKEVESDKVQGGQVVKSKRVVDVKLNNGDKSQGEVAPKQDGPVSKKAVSLDSKTAGVSKKDTNKTLHAGQNAADKPDSKMNQKDEHTKPGTKAMEPEAVKPRLVQTTPAQPPNKDVKEEHSNKQVRATVPIGLNADKEPPKPTVNHQVAAAAAAAKAHHNATAVRKSGVHSVLSLDLTQSPRNANAVGQFGLAAFVPSSENAEVKKRWNEGHFNVHLSDKIPVDRAIPDTRPQKCTGNLVHDDLPSTSVIFCFVDEVWSTLLRSVHSVLNRSPPHLLKEIILVDDFSTKDYLKKQLDEYMSQFPKVRIIRLTERQGLIRARLAGAAAAKGDVLTFLDSHIECNVGWLEPLLERIYLDRKKVPCPVIEVISDKDMSYVLVDSFQRGIFKWPLVFGWSPVPQEYIKKNKMTDADPIRCPVMAGGLFSIDKSYFFELGSYDPGLDVWGGENMEISFKIWMCGGEIEILPCSRVGHIFRGQNPYKFPKDRQKTVERNLARVAEVWLDEYKDLFYGHGYHHLLDKSVIDIGNLTAQVELRKKLNCNSFRWYLQNVYPDMDAPLVKADGLVYNRGLRKCLALQNGSLSFETCDLSKQTQHFNYTWLRHIQHQDLCVAPQAEGNAVALQKCEKAKHELRWMYKSLSAPKSEHFISEISLQMCLEAKSQGAPVVISRCDSNSAFQKWQLTHQYAQ